MLEKQVCFVEIDLVQAEWIVTAYLAQDANMIAIIESGADPHVSTGALISGAPIGVIVAENKLLGHLSDPHEIAAARKSVLVGDKPLSLAGWFLPRTMSIRQCGKRSNHGLNYGMKKDKFALINETDENEAERIISAYHEAYSGLRRYYKQTEYELKENGRRLTNCFGQSRRFLDKFDYELLMAAYAFKPQSTVANITCMGWQLVYEKGPPGVRLSAQVHDSVLTTNTFESTRELARQIHLCDAFFTLPFLYHGTPYTLKRDIKIGVSWGEDCMIKPKTIDAPGVEAALEESRVAKAARLH